MQTTSDTRIGSGTSRRFGLTLAALIPVLAVAAGSTALLSPSLSQATTIVLRSGNGTIGSTDSEITMLVGPANRPFPSSLQPSDFAAARTGPAAQIISKKATWKAGLDSDPTAQWINNGEDGTALYAINFSLSASELARATLDFVFLVDNQLGDTNNEGLFVNGLPVVNSKVPASGQSGGGLFNGPDRRLSFDITSFVVEGDNTLYVNQHDWGSVAGLIFSAEITVPEPSTALLLATGVAGLAVRRRH